MGRCRPRARARVRCGAHLTCTPLHRGPRSGLSIGKERSSPDAMRVSDELEQNKMREDTLRSLGELLEAHIRLEERQVFPLIEETLAEHALRGGPPPRSFRAGTTS